MTQTSVTVAPPAVTQTSVNVAPPAVTQTSVTVAPPSVTQTSVNVAPLAVATFKKTSPSLLVHDVEKNLFNKGYVLNLHAF